MKELRQEGKMGQIPDYSPTMKPEFPKFTSSTMVLVEQPTVPTDIVKPVVNDDLNHRLASMSEQVLSRTRLQAIIEKLNLYPRGLAADQEDAVNRLRKAIDVGLTQPMAGSENRHPPGFPPGFHASVTFGDAHLAHEEEQTNLSLLNGLNSQLDATTQAFSRAQEEKVATETLLSSQESIWKATQAGNQNPETQEQQLAALQDQLTILLSKYTPEHPDVINSRRLKN